MTRRVRDWWMFLRFAALRRARSGPTRSEMMLERLRAEFALEPVPQRRTTR